MKNNKTAQYMNTGTQAVEKSSNTQGDVYLAGISKAQFQSEAGEMNSAPRLRAQSSLSSSTTE